LHHRSPLFKTDILGEKRSKLSLFKVSPISDDNDWQIFYRMAVGLKCKFGNKELIPEESLFL
jgi:hypothetical protein